MPTLNLDTAVHISSHTFHNNTVGGTNGAATIRFCIVCDDGRFWITDTHYVPLNDFTTLDHAAAYANAFRHFPSLQQKVDDAIRQAKNLRSSL